MATQLSPSQQREFDRLMGMLPVGNIFVLYTGSGMGCSTLLKEVHRTCGGKLLTMQDFVDSLENKHPLQMEETLYALVLESLRSSDVVVMDDLSLIESIACNHFYQRSNMLRIILTALTTYAIETDKKLIFGASGAVSNPVDQRCYYAGFKHFLVEDYEFLCKFYLNEAAREQILRLNLDTLPEEINHPDIARIVQATEGFTGADLKRLVDDAKVLYAYDLACERPVQPATDYYLAAVEKVLANKERYMEAEAIARQHRPQRPPWFRMYSAYVSDDDE